MMLPQHRPIGKRIGGEPVSGEETFGHRAIQRDRAPAFLDREKLGTHHRDDTPSLDERQEVIPELFGIRR
ncbi:MAG: hypothetical protein H0X65_20540 [Gemmatimonadetes bacterium]|nr:hypothetical protein [Gemmatimonadota bacterium]